jgi:hypothetical protein
VPDPGVADALAGDFEEVVLILPGSIPLPQGTTIGGPVIQP